MAQKIKLYGLLLFIFLIFYLIRLGQTQQQLKPPQLAVASNLSHKIEQTFEYTLVEPQASLLSGIVLGRKKSLSKTFYQALQTTGTLHLVVASGMNVTLTSGLLLALLASLVGRQKASLLSILAIVFYCFMVGFEPAIVRASLMVGTIYLGVFFGRETDSLLALILTAMIMLIISPRLINNVGFLLSFSATLGLIVLTPKLKKLFKKVKFNREELVQTLSAQALTLPIILINFGHYNPFSLIPNLLVLPLVPYLMILGVILGLSGLILYPLAKVVAMLIYLPLTYFTSVISFFGQFKFMDFPLSGLSWLFAIGYYLVLLSIIISKK